MATLELYNSLRGETLALEWPRYVVSAWTPRAIRETGTESLEIELHGVTPEACYARATTLETWLQDAQEAVSDNRLSPVWLRHTPGDREQRSARVLGGTLELSEYCGYTSHGRLLAGLLEIQRDQARGAEIAVPITNVNGTDVSTGLTVENGAETTLSNWVALAGDDVTGDLPAPFRLVVQNTYNNERRLRRFLYGLRHLSTGPTHGAFLKDASQAVEGLGLYADAAANLGYVLRGTGALVAEWEFPSSSTREWEGTWRAFAVGTFNTHATYWLESRVIVTELDAGEPISPEVTITAADHLVDLGTIELPPWPKVEPPAVPYLFNLQLRCDGQYETTLDYVLFIPTDLGFRDLVYRAYNAVYQQYTVDDGINDEVAAHYAARAGSIVRGVGKRPFLVPGRAQRLYFLQAGDQGDALKARTVSVRVEYAPRFALL